MGNKKNRLILLMMIAAMLLHSTIVFPNPSLANQTAEAPAVHSPAKEGTAGDIGKAITIASGTTAILKDVKSIPVESGQIIFVSLDVHNQSGSEFDFYPYWLRIQSSVGEKFKVQTVDDKQSNKVYPNSTRSFAYFAEVPHQQPLTDLRIQLIKWDFSSSNYERLVHSFSVPEQNDIAVVQQGELGKIEIQGVPVTLEVTDVREMEGALRKTGNFTLSFINEGNRAVKLPAYEYQLRGNGISYPAQLKSVEEEIILLPGIEKKIGLTVQIALESALADYRLVVSELKEDVEPLFSVPLTSFAFDVPDGHAGGVPVGETTSFMYGSFDFDLRVENIHLVPSSGSDNILSYEVYITNKNRSRVALPKLASYVHIKDESPQLATQKEEEKNEIFPDEELKLTMFAPIPERANISELSITFESSIGENPNGELDALEEVFATYLVTSGNIKREGAFVSDEHHFSDLGDKSIIKHYQTTTYDTNSSKILVSQFLVENKENRPIRVPEYKGYFQSSRGEIFPVQYKGRAGEIINPNGAAIVTFWSEVSRGLEIKDIRLVLGVPIDEESEALSEVASFQVVNQSTTERSTAYPLQYYISGMRVSASVREELNRVREDPDGLGYFRELGSISIEYTVRKNYQDNVLDDNYERSLTFELRDSGGTLLDRSEGIKINDLHAGRNSISLSANVSLQEVFSLRVRVYEEFEHGRKSLGSYSIGW